MVFGKSFNLCDPNSDLFKEYFTLILAPLYYF